MGGFEIFWGVFEVSFEVSFMGLICGVGLECMRLHTKQGYRTTTTTTKNNNNNNNEQQQQQQQRTTTTTTNNNNEQQQRTTTTTTTTTTTSFHTLSLKSGFWNLGCAECCAVNLSTRLLSVAFGNQHSSSIRLKMPIGWRGR